MKNVEQLLSQPGVGHKVVRQAIVTPAGTAATIKVEDSAIKVAVLKQRAISIFAALLYLLYLSGMFL